MKNFFKQIESRNEITASKQEHVKMSLRIVWSKTNGLISLKNERRMKFQENMMLLMLIIHKQIARL